jgi:hypothetical protein
MIMLNLKLVLDMLTCRSLVPIPMWHLQIDVEEKLG